MVIGLNIYCVLRLKMYFCIFIVSTVPNEFKNRWGFLSRMLFLLQFLRQLMIDEFFYICVGKV